MAISLKQYTWRHLAIAILVLMTIWASIFYAFILDEVYDNVDDGLRNQKILILREVYENPDILKTNEFGISQFKISPASQDSFSERNILTNEFFYMPYDDEDEPYRVLTTGFYGPDRQPYYLKIRTSTVERDDFVVDLSIALAVLYIVMLGGIFMLNEFVLRRAWKPFRSILASLSNYQVGKSARLAPIWTDVKEFKALHSHVDEMIARNDAVFAEQKLFIENASHELQTPLAITINKLELMMEDEQLSEGHVVQLNEVKTNLQRLVNLNKSLLVLSKIGNRQFDKVGPVDMNAITTEILASLDDIATHKGLSISVEEQGAFIVDANQDLIYMALSNLIRNAIRYTNGDGQISISIYSDKWQIQNTSNSGALPQDFIYNRFYKGSDSQQSNGLGLSIVQSIMNVTPGLRISYTFEENFHIFSISVSHS